MAKVFVSYSRKDIEFAKQLTAELQKSDLDFWIDWEGIPPTVDWWREIEKGIEESDVFVFLISPDSAKSKICGKEIDCAVKNGKRLIPLVVRDIKGDETPSQLSHLNWIFFRESDDFDAGLKKLLTGIHTDYEWVKEHRWLQVRALDWQRENRDNGSLLRGKDLQDAEFQLATNTSKEPHPTDLQREYVFASRKAAERQRNITIGIAIAGAIALAALAVWGWGQAGLATFNANEANKNAAAANAASTLAFENAIKADHEAATAQAASTLAVYNETEAERQAQIAFARQLAAEANVILASPNGNSEAAALLSLRALQLQPDVYIPSADAALVASLDHLYTAKILNEYGAKVSAVAFSTNGDQISIGYVDGTAGLYDVNTGMELKHFDVEFRNYDGNQYEEGIHAVSFSADGNSLLVADSGGHIVVWDLVTSTQEIDFHVQENLPLWSAKFSPDGLYILISTGYPHSGPGNIYLYDRQTGKLNLSFDQLHERYITDVEFSKDGNKILSTSWDKTAILWEMDWETFQATPFQTFKLSAPIRDGAISSNGEFVLLGSDNNSAELYTTDGVAKQKFVGHTSPVFSVNFSPDGSYILTGSWDNTARLWDIQSGNVIRLFANHSNFVSSTAFSPDGKQIITGSYDRTARLWNADPLHETRSIYGHSNRINSVSYSPDGKFILSSSNDSSVRLWNSETLEQSAALNTSTSLFEPMAVFSAQGNWIAAKSGGWTDQNDLKLVLWEKVGTKYDQTEIRPQGTVITSLAFSSRTIRDQSEYLLLGTVSCQALLLKVASWDFIGGYWGNCWNHDIAMTTDAEYVAVAGEYDISIYRVDDQNTAVASCTGSHIVAFSSDGKYLASQLENDILIWDWQADPGGNTPHECTQVKRLSGHSATVTDLTFSSDGNNLLSASLDGSAILWETKTWEPIRTLIGHEGEVTSAAFSPDSKLIVTGGGDNTIRIWDTDYKATIQLVCSLLQRLDRDFTDEERRVYGINDTDPTCGR